MAKHTNTHPSGRLSNTIYYILNGQLCSRSMPGKVRQTKATKESAKAFGKAVQVAKMLRWGLKAFLADNEDRRVQYRIDNAVMKWLRHGRPVGPNEELIPDPWEELFRFQFNPKTALDFRVKVPITVDWSNPQQAVLHLPEMNPKKQIMAPANTRLLHWMITLTGTTIAHPERTQSYDARFDMLYRNETIPARQILMPCALVPDSLTVVAVWVRYSVEVRRSLKMCPDDPWTPAAIVDAHYEPATEPIKKISRFRVAKENDHEPVILNLGFTNQRESRYNEQHMEILLKKNIPGNANKDQPPDGT
jgi:hypothetical protein